MSSLSIANNKPVDKIEARIYFNQRILPWLMLLVLASPFVYTWLQGLRTDIIQELKVENFAIDGPSVLCPTDRLVVRFDFKGRGQGNFDQDATLFRVTPPQTIISSSTKRYVLAGDFARVAYRSWLVPSFYEDERTGRMMPLEPGEYRLQYSLSAVSNDAVSDVDTAQFTIPPGCGKD